MKSEDTVRALNAIGFKPGSGTPEPMARRLNATWNYFRQSFASDS